MKRWLIALGAWTVFMWANRINNIAEDRSWRMLVAFAFTFAGVGLIGLAFAQRARLAAKLGAGLAVAGILWWPPRAIMTLFDDFSVPFKIVHTVLALVTVGLGLLVLGQLRVSSSRYG